MFDQQGLPDLTTDVDAVTGLPTERLEAEMMTLAGHLAAAMCSFLVLVAEFDRRKGHEDWECLSTAHWLNWRCGVGLSAAREQVRVARRLGELPVVRTEFAAGRLSYSKVRAITRVADPAIEEGLVRMAQSATAAQMDRACRALRRTQDLAAADAELADEEDAARERRSVSWRRTDDGEVIITARLPAEGAETVLAALNEATEDSEKIEGEPAVPLDHRRADALVDLAAHYLAHPDTGEGASPEIIVHVDAVAAAELAGHEEPAGRSWRGPVRWPATTARGVPLSFASVQRLCCDAGVRFVATLPDGSELDLGRHQRTVNRAQRRALHARDRHCRFPGCDRRRRLHAHHIVHWEHGGPTDMDNLLLLCPKHHHAVHEGGWRLSGTAADHTFTRPTGDAVEPDAPLLTGSTSTLVHRHAQHGRDIALQGVGGRWHGERIDWSCFFAAFAN